MPRPYIITPPHTEKERYEPGETCTFGFTLIGSASKLYPYIIRAFQEMERNTLGHPIQELRGQRGRFLVREIQAVHPFTGQRMSLWQRGTTRPEKLQLCITDDDVVARAKQLSADSLTIHFLSPTRLIADDHVLRQPKLGVLALRMAQRLEQVQQEYGSVEESNSGREWYLSIKDQIGKVYLAHDETRWVDIHSYSARQRQKMPIGGFVGRASFVGSIATLHELLVWGEVLRVGKNIVKGAGFYHIET
jgi:hypothetical protein